MKLLELDPHFIRHGVREDTWTREKPDGGEEQVVGQREFITDVATIAEAQGVRFLCPKCFSANGGPVGTHGVICWSRSRGIADDVRPAPGRWRLDGTCLADLTLNADPPSSARSVQLLVGCTWHGFITNGDAHE